MYGRIADNARILLQGGGEGLTLTSFGTPVKKKGLKGQGHGVGLVSRKRGGVLRRCRPVEKKPRRGENELSQQHNGGEKFAQGVRPRSEDAENLRQAHHSNKQSREFSNLRVASFISKKFRHQRLRRVVR